MNKSVATSLVVIVLILGAVGALLVTHKSSAPSSKSATTSTTSSSDMSKMDMNGSSSSSANSNSSAAAATNAVTIEDFAFSPANITVKKGTTVTWTNQDTVGHNVIETDGQTGPKSSTLAKGQTYSFTYDSVGTFKYDCSIHPNMIGTVTVTE